jgi:hypothetical protein
MNFLNTFPAIVVDNKDRKLKGRVQIRIPHLHEGVDDNDLPWAYPMTSINGGYSSSLFSTDSVYGSSFIPEKDSKIWVAIENMDLLDPIFYISSFMWDDESAKIFSTFEQVDGLNIGLSSQYPNVKFIKLKNGVTVGLSSDTNNPEIFMYHPKGSSLKFRSNGSIEVKSPDDSVSIVIENGVIRINASSDSVIRSKGTWRHSGDFYAVGEVIARSKSDNISLAKHMHPSAVPGNPSAPTITPANETDTDLVNPDIGIYTPQIALDLDTIKLVPGVGEIGMSDEEEYGEETLPSTVDSGDNY